MAGEQLWSPVGGGARWRRWTTLAGGRVRRSSLGRRGRGCWREGEGTLLSFLKIKTLYIFFIFILNYNWVFGLKTNPTGSV